MHFIFGGVKFRKPNGVLTSSQHMTPSHARKRFRCPRAPNRPSGTVCSKIIGLQPPRLGSLSSGPKGFFKKMKDLCTYVISFVLCVGRNQIESAQGFSHSTVRNPLRRKKLCIDANLTHVNPIVSAKAFDPSMEDMEKEHWRISQ